MSASFLKHKQILVTRPIGRADKLCQLINDAGGEAIHYPVIDITPVKKSPQLQQIIEDLPLYDIAIFISPSAVIETLKQLSLPNKIKVAAIGSKTELMLKQHGIKTSIKSTGLNSEALLTHPAFQSKEINCKKIVIFRGIGGRELLANTLKERGAITDYAETYQRGLAKLPSLTKNQIEQLDAITISSNEGLDNLMSLVDKQLPVFNIPIIVASPKTYDNAKSYGFKSIHLADNASDEACFLVITKLFH